MNINLSKKNAIVCGSTRGIGKAAALELAANGANVTLVSRNGILLKEVIKELSNDGSQKHGFIAVDFSHPQKLKGKIKRFAADNPPVHILVNNTGGPKPGEIVNADISEFRMAFEQHLICNHILVQALIPGMKKEKYGRIINIISTSVKEPIDRLGVSNTIRAAVASWAKTLSFELGSSGITVNNVLPGSTKTDRLTSIIESVSKTYGISVKDAEKDWLSKVPAARFGEPGELAGVIAFLASPAASYINGVSLAVDGGRTRSL
ncbi:MAG: SDR family oxidoreductase [Ignavibacteria bacterium]